MANLLDEVYTQQHVRGFFQFGGARPSNPLLYYGTGAQYFFVTGVSQSRGSIEATYAPSPRGGAGNYTLVSRQRGTPDLPEATLTMLQKIGTVPRVLGTCPFNLLMVASNCRDLSNPVSGFDFAVILDSFETESDDLGDLNSMDSTDPLQTEYPIKGTNIYRVSSLSFGFEGDALIDRMVVDGVYGDGTSCGTCTPRDDGTRHLYLVTKSSGGGSPGIPASVIHIDRNPITGNVTEREYALNTGTNDPVFIDIMGGKLIVGMANSYLYATLDPMTGIPGAWTTVSSGFVSGKTFSDIWVKDANTAFISAAGGYIYRISSVGGTIGVANAASATVQDLHRIHGRGDTIVAVGDSGHVVRSTNGGKTWARTSTDAGASALSGVQVFDSAYMQIVSAGGIHYTTEDGGYSWATLQIPGATAASDIVYVTDSVGYIAYNDGNQAQLAATISGGSVWMDSYGENSRIKAWPTFGEATRVVAPTAADATIACGAVTVCGAVTAGDVNSDGVAVIGLTTYL